MSLSPPHAAETRQSLSVVESPGFVLFFGCDWIIVPRAMSDPAQFPTTQWMLLGKSGVRDTSVKRAALDDLVRLYWDPVYIYVRRKGHPPHLAADLTQNFFVRFCERDSFAGAREEKGKFRSYLLVSLNRFLHDSWRYENALCRCPEKMVSLDIAQAEELLRVRSNAPPPDVEYDQNWTKAMLARAFERLKEHYAAGGKGYLWTYVSAWLMGDPGAISYAEAEAMLGMSNAALRKEVSRARQLLRQSVVDEVSLTVASPDELEAELRYLTQVWGGGS